MSEPVGVKTDYFNRIRVLVTQIMPGMVIDHNIPAKTQLSFVMKAYDKFDRIQTIQANDVLKSYQAAYIKNLHLLIKKELKEREVKI